VTSEFPASLEGQKTQRVRWESGHLNTIAWLLPRLLFEALGKANYVLLAQVVDAAVPPVAFLALLIFAYTCLALPIAILAGSTVVLGFASAICLLFASAILLAWWQVGRGVLSLYELALAPCYVFSKLGLYGCVLIGRKVVWRRSKRGAR
jgi:hypothetical protein